MKKLKYSLFIAVLGMTFSCQQDTTLDPFQLDKVKKGTLLALRGDYYYSLDFNGCALWISAADISANNTDKFSFEAEYLAADPNSLSSCDIYAIKINPDNSRTRVKIATVPASQFILDKTKYERPYVDISIPQNTILNAIGITNYDATDTNTLLTTYQYGVRIETDLNLKDGSTAPASAVVAAGLFQSDQFYPAQKLTYCVR